MTLDRNTAIELWRLAHAQEIGLTISVPPEETQRALNLLYDHRKELGDESLNDIMLCPFPETGEIFFKRKSVELE